MTGVRSPHHAWAANIHDGAWIANETAGGCRNYIRERYFFFKYSHDEVEKFCQVFLESIHFVTKYMTSRLSAVTLGLVYLKTQHLIHSVKFLFLVLSKLVLCLF